MLRILCFALLMYFGCRKTYSNENTVVPVQLKSIINSGQNCECKSYLISLDYKGSTYYTMGVDNYLCDILALYYDRAGNKITDQVLAAEISAKGKNKKRVFNCGDL